MALGTNYRRGNDKTDKLITANLAKHDQRMKELIEQGVSREEASKQAFKELTGR